MTIQDTLDVLVGTPIDCLSNVTFADAMTVPFVSNLMIAASLAKTPSQTTTKQRCELMNCVRKLPALSDRSNLSRP